MSNEKYIDRDTGNVLQEQVAQRGLFHWMYATSGGNVVRELLMRSKVLHWLVAQYCNSQFSRGMIGRLISLTKINIDELEQPLQSYRSFNAFFTRKIPMHTRPIDAGEEVFIAPGDGKLFVIPNLEMDTLIQIKGMQFSVAQLVQDEPLASRYRYGSAMVLRLYLGDYHRLHFPASGTPRTPRLLPGHYYSVTPFDGNAINFYCRNQRTVTEFDSDHFGRMCFVDIGGFLISSINASFEPDAKVQKGQEKSSFAFGGSTLVVLVERACIDWDPDLLDNSANGLETFVRLGTRIGVRPGIRDHHG